MAVMKEHDDDDYEEIEMDENGDSDVDAENHEFPRNTNITNEYSESAPGLMAETFYY